jgi:hypothetical protein
VGSGFNEIDRVSKIYRLEEEGGEGGEEGGEYGGEDEES